jgi:hypothetical protein
MGTRKLRLSIRRNDQEAEELEAELTEADIEVLREFSANVVRLEECRLVKENLLPRLQKFGVDRERGLWFERSEADPDLLAAALHWSRPLILYREHASFMKVKNIFARLFESSIVRDFLKHLVARFKDGQSAQFFQLRTGKSKDDLTSLLSDETLSLWLNSTQYHRDQKKSLLVAELAEGVGAELLEALMQNLFVERIDAVRQLHAQIVRPALMRLDAAVPIEGSQSARST